MKLSSNKNKSVPNPSQSVTACDGFKADSMNNQKNSGDLAESITNSSRVSVTDSGIGKSIYNKYIYYFIINMSRMHTPARAMRVCAHARG